MKTTSIETESAPPAAQEASAGAGKPSGARAKGKAGKKATPAKKAPAKAAPKKTAAREAKKPAAEKPDSKAAQVIAMLRTKNGASLTEIMEKTGWLKHSVRGFISGALKTKLGLEVESFQNDAKERCYRIVKG